MKIENILIYLNLYYFNLLNFKYYFKIFSRNLKLTKNFLNLKLAVYNGKFFIPIKITENQINFKKENTLLGSYIFTKIILLKNLNKKRRRKKKKK